MLISLITHISHSLSSPAFSVCNISIPVVLIPAVLLPVVLLPAVLIEDVSGVSTKPDNINFKETDSILRSRLNSFSSDSDYSENSSSNISNITSIEEDLFLKNLYVVDNPKNPDAETIKVPRARLEMLEELNENLVSIVKESIKRECQ
jgi:hypothetical protein